MGIIMGEGVPQLVCQVGRHNASCILHSYSAHFLQTHHKFDSSTCNGAILTKIGKKCHAEL